MQKRSVFALVSIVILLMTTACGSGADSEATLPPSIPTPIVPRLLLAAATGNTTAAISWGISEQDVVYEIHADQRQDFEPTPATLKGSVKGSNEALIENLTPGITYEFKIIASRAGSSRIISENSLSTTTSKSPLTLREEVNLVEDGSLNLTAIAACDIEIQYSWTASSKMPRIGSYITGKVAGNEVLYYFRRVTGLELSSSTLTVKTENVELTEIIATGSVSFTIDGGEMKHVETPEQKSALNSSATNCVGKYAGGIISLLPTLTASQFGHPIIKAEVGVDNQNKPFVQAGLKASAKTDYKVSVPADAAYRCALRIAETDSAVRTFFIPFTPPIPVAVAAAFVVENRASVQSSLGVGLSISGTVSTDFDRAIRITAPGHVELFGSGINLSGTGAPKLAVTDAVYDASLEAGPAFFVETSIGLGFKKNIFGYTVDLSLMTPIAQIGVKSGPQARWGVESVEDEYLKKIRATQIKELTAALDASFFYRIGITSKLQKFLGVSLAVSNEATIANAKLFQISDLDLAITPFESTTSAAELTSEGG